MSISERLANQQAHINKLYEKIEELQANIKALEQLSSYYPNKAEIKNIKWGGTD